MSHVVAAARIRFAAWAVGLSVAMARTRLSTLALGFSGLVVALGLALASACGSSSGGDGPTGGPVAGATDTHCAGRAQVVDPSTCHAPGSPIPADYGPTQYNSSGDDDDCKYQVSFTSTPVRRNQNVTFTVTAKSLADLQPATGANIDAEVFLNDTHPAPNSGQATTEKAGGVYDVGPIKFDAAGRWTVRFHLHEDCQDSTEDSPHGHIAFYIDVP